MRHCPQCNKPIRQGESLAILALSVNCTKDDAVYDLLSDFFDKETVLHSNCLKAYVNNLPGGEKIGKMAPVSNSTQVAAPYVPLSVNTNMLATRIITILRELGDDSPRGDIIRFVVENKNLGHADLLRKWFQEKSTL